MSHLTDFVCYLPTPHSLFLTNIIKLDGIPSNIKWKIHACFIVNSSFEGTFYKKLQNIATSSFISCCFKSAFLSTDIIFCNFSEVDSKLDIKNFCHKCPFFNRFKHPPLTPQQRKSAKYDKSFPLTLPKPSKTNFHPNQWTIGCYLLNSLPHAINSLATNIFSVKGILWPIFCIDINTHSDRKWKIM